MNSQPMHLPVSRSWWSCHEFSKHGSARVSGSESCSTRASSNPAEPNRSWARGNLFKLDLNSLSGNRQQETFSGATDPPSQGPPGRQQIGTVGELHTIWQGVLEWNEKAENPNDPQKLTRHVPCQVSLGPRDGDSDLKADSWPQKLIMQLMPKHLIGNIGGVYLKNSKSVLFHPQQCEALESLTKVMSSGFAGCVHFTSMPSPASCNIKVLILLYTSEKRAYLGFIPNDQAAFVDRLRKVIQHQKTTQALIRQQGQSNERHLGGPGANQQKQQQPGGSSGPLRGQGMMSGQLKDESQSQTFSPDFEDSSVIEECLVPKDANEHLKPVTIASILPSSSSTPSTSGASTKKRKSDRDMTTQETEILNKIQNILENVRKSKEVKGDLDVLGELVSITLKSIKNRKLVLKAKKQISDVLLSLQEEDLQERERTRRENCQK